MKVEYEFLRKKDEKDVYSMDLASYVDENHRESDGNYYEVCPVCKEKHDKGIDGYYIDHNYSKRKLGILPSKSVGHCNRCGAIFVDKSDYCKIYIPKWGLTGPLLSEDINIVKLSNINEVLKSSSPLTEKEIAVLKARNPFIDPEKLGMRSLRAWDRPNILTPFYIMGSPVYYQLRFLDREQPKYFSASILKKPLFIPKGTIGMNKIMICEGVYDALAIQHLYPDHMPMAILGSHITEYQINLIRKYYTPDEVSIFMDDTHISKGIRDTIMHSPLSYYIDEINIIESDGVDPEELLRQNNNLEVKLDIASIYENYDKR